MDKSPFRKLPTEVRCMIWNMVFEASPGVKRNKMIRLCKSHRSSGGVGIPSSGRALRLGITRTCKELRKESYHALFFKAHIDFRLDLPRLSVRHPDAAQRELVNSVSKLKFWLQTIPFGHQIRRLTLDVKNLNPLEPIGFPLWSTLNDLFPTNETRLLLPKLIAPLKLTLELGYGFADPDPICPCEYHEDELDRSTFDPASDLDKSIPLGDKNTARVAFDDMKKGLFENIDKELQLRFPECTAGDRCFSVLTQLDAQTLVESLFGNA